jgi:hypothetical protein
MVGNTGCLAGMTGHKLPQPENQSGMTRPSASHTDHTLSAQKFPPFKEGADFMDHNFGHSFEI